jgi:hypothetical protein
MAHDCFISYASKDSPVANAICAALEREKITCWMAPRDILPSSNYGESIINGINQARAVVLVFSANANRSAHIVTEVDRAFSKRKPILPIRIEDVPLSPSLEYYLSAAQWQDASPPIHNHLPAIVGTVRAVLRQPASIDSPEPIVPMKSAISIKAQTRRPLSRFRYILIGAAALVLLSLGYFAWTKYGRRAAGPASQLVFDSKPISSPAYQDEVLLYNQSFDGIDLDHQGKVFWVDQYSGTLGTFDLGTKQLEILLHELNSPNKVRLAGSKAYFIETGTEGNHYKDGHLSYVDINSRQVHRLIGNLNYPNGLWVSLMGDVYFTEGAGSSTSFGGVNQLCVLRGGSTSKIVLGDVTSPTCVAATQGLIFVGSMGESVPGETGSLSMIVWNREASKIQAQETIVEKISSPEDLALDRFENIYIAGSGQKNGTFAGITQVSMKRPFTPVTLKSGVRVQSLSTDTNGDIYYSTRVPEKSLRVMRLKHG